jgi:transcriptional regulator with XRE-family HTH domain
MIDRNDNPDLARTWRRSLGLSRERLSQLTGYSIGHIRNMESGINHSSGKPIPARTFTRYRMLCAAVHAGLDFDFRTCTLRSSAQAAKGMRNLIRL